MRRGSPWWRGRWGLGTHKLIERSRAGTIHKHTDVMPNKKTSNTHSTPEVDRAAPRAAWLVAKMPDGSRWKLPVYKLLENMADRWQEYWAEEGSPGTREEALAEAWHELEKNASREEGMGDFMIFDGVSQWADWEDVAERLPDERPDPKDMWADAEIVLCQPNN